MTFFKCLRVVNTFYLVKIKKRNLKCLDIFNVYKFLKNNFNDLVFKF